MTYKVRQCPVCGRKRRIWLSHTFEKVTELFGVKRSRPYRRWICSQGHNWDTVVMNSQLLTDGMEQLYLPAVKDFFGKDSVFISKLIK